MIAELGRRFPAAPGRHRLFPGGNMLVNLLAQACPAPLKAAVVVSARCNWQAVPIGSIRGLLTGLSDYLLRTMQTNLQSKIRRQSAAQARWQPPRSPALPLGSSGELVTAPLHGFSADHYYQTCSGLSLLARIPSRPSSFTPPTILHDRCRHSGSGGSSPLWCATAEPPGQPWASCTALPGAPLLAG